MLDKIVIVFMSIAIAMWLFLMLLIAYFGAP